MQPQTLTAADWVELSRVLVHLYLLVAFTVVGATAWLLHAAILPSLVASGHVPGSVLRWRIVLGPAGLLALALVLVTFTRALVLAVVVLQRIYPRFQV